MGKYIKIIVIVVALVLTACGGTKKGTAPKQLKRSPIVEVGAEELAHDALLIEAKAQQENGFRAEALEKYHKLLKEAPSYAAAYYEIGRIKMSVGELDSALLCTQKASQLEPKNIWYKLQLASIYQQRHEMKPLIKTWEQLIELKPDVLDYYYELSNAQMLNEDITGAIQTLNRVEKKVGVTEMVSVQKQKLWEAIGEEKKAVEEIERLAEAMPQEKKYSAILAELYMKQKDYKKAKIYYDLILQHHPEDEYIHISLANYYKQTQQPEKAYEELRQGFESAGMDCKSKLQILGAFYTSEEFYGAYSKYSFALLDQLMGQCDDSTTYALFYGDVLMRQEKYDEASRQFAIHLKKDSSQYEVWEALLVCLSMSKDREEEMLEWSRRASSLFPLHTLPYYLQGVSAYQRKQYKESIELLKQCEKIGFNKGYLEAETYGLMASDYYELGEYDQAWKYFDKALEKNPGDIGTMNNYAYFLSVRNEQLEKAEGMSRKTIDKEPENATFLDTYAWILHQLGRDKEALTYIEKAVRLDKEGSETLKEHKQAIEKAIP